MNTAVATSSPVSTTASAGERRGLHYGLWAVQGLLALAFLAAGMMKLTTPMEQLAEAMAWIDGPLGPMVRFIGLAEVAGAIGLILPAATRIKPKLTAAAALGLLTVMVLGALTHAVMGDWAGMPASVVLGGLAGFVVWGRAKGAPITPR